MRRSLAPDWGRGGYDAAVESPGNHQKTVVFDLFHTLVDPDDFRPSGFRRLEAAAAVLGVPFAVLEAAWNGAVADLVRGRESVRGLLRRVAHESGRPARTMDIAPAAEALGRYQDLALLHPRREIVELLADLDDWTVGLLSNCHDRDVEAWAQSPLTKRIDHVVFSTKAQAAKPDQAAYDAILSAMDIAARDVTYIGNGGDNELAGARLAGMGKVVHFAAFDDLRQRTDEAERSRRCDAADVTIDTFDELRGLFAAS